MLDAEEVFYFQLAVFGKVGAMQSIICPCVTELGSQGVWPQILRNLWVHWSDKLPERLDSVLLSDFHDDAWADGHGLYHTDELGQDSLVHLEELLGRRFVKREHLHG